MGGPRRRAKLTREGRREGIEESVAADGSCPLLFATVSQKNPGKSTPRRVTQHNGYSDQEETCYLRGLPDNRLVSLPTAGLAGKSVGLYLSRVRRVAKVLSVTPSTRTLCKFERLRDMTKSHPALLLSVGAAGRAAGQAPCVPVRVLSLVNAVPLTGHRAFLTTTAMLHLAGGVIALRAPRARRVQRRTSCGPKDRVHSLMAFDGSGFGTTVPRDLPRTAGQ